MNKEKEFVPYELAIKLKDIGFDEGCLGFYTNNKKLHVEYTESIPGWKNSDLHNAVVAPTFSQTFRWFRKVYQLVGTPNWYSGGFYCYTIKNINIENSAKLFTEFKTYEEAELACLEKLIEIV